MHTDQELLFLLLLWTPTLKLSLTWWLTLWEGHLPSGFSSWGLFCTAGSPPPGLLENKEVSSPCWAWSPAGRGWWPRHLRQGQCQSFGKTDLIITLRINGRKLSLCAPIVTTSWSHKAPVWHLLKNVAVNIACLQFYFLPLEWKAIKENSF